MAFRMSLYVINTNALSYVLGQCHTQLNPFVLFPICRPPILFLYISHDKDLRHHLRLLINLQQGQRLNREDRRQSKQRWMITRYYILVCACLSYLCRVKSPAYTRSQGASITRLRFNINLHMNEATHYEPD